jgi:peptide/nickel transport system permease protein
MRRFLPPRIRNAGALLGGTVLIIVTLTAIIGPALAPVDAGDIDLANRLAPPVWSDSGTWEHPLGTDSLGHDQLTRMIDGARVSMTTGAGVVLLAGIVGIALGLLAGYHGGFRDSAIMRFVDASTAFPGLLLALIVLTMVGAGQLTIILVLSGVGWMIYTRVTRDTVRGLRDASFVRAAEVTGASRTRVVGRHILPNLASPLLTIATLEFANVVLAEASLSYLGFGIQPPDSSWGLMISEGQSKLDSAPWLVTVPGAAIALVVLSLNLVAGWLRVSSDPRQRDRQLVRRTRVRRPAPAAPIPQSPALLAIEDLRVEFPRKNGPPLAAVDGASLAVAPGGTLGIVGESGSGKSMTVLAAMDLIPPPGAATGGVIRWRGEDLNRRGLREEVVGRKMTMVFQDPHASLNPLMPVGRQITEVLRRHRRMDARDADRRALELLDLVGIATPERRLSQLPFELSGGMAQRVMIAMALAPEPELILADEPTTALDVTIQAQILQLIKDLQAELGMAVVLIAHDLGVVSGLCDQVVVMRAGRVVEAGAAERVFGRPEHEYTSALLAATPRLDRPRRAPVTGGLEHA